MACMAVTQDDCMDAGGRGRSSASGNCSCVALPPASMPSPALAAFAHPCAAQRRSSCRAVAEQLQAIAMAGMFAGNAGRLHGCRSSCRARRRLPAARGFTLVEDHATLQSEIGPGASTITPAAWIHQDPEREAPARDRDDHVFQRRDEMMIIEKTARLSTFFHLARFAG